MSRTLGPYSYTILPRKPHDPVPKRRQTPPMQSQGRGLPLPLANSLASPPTTPPTSRGTRSSLPTRRQMQHLQDRDEQLCATSRRQAASETMSTRQRKTREIPKLTNIPRRGPGDPGEKGAGRGRQSPASERPTPDCTGSFCPV
jgi:hypothetical protein